MKQGEFSEERIIGLLQEAEKGEKMWISWHPNITV